MDGNVPSIGLSSSLTSAKCAAAAQLPGRVPVRLLREMFKTERLVGSALGRGPDNWLKDRSSSLKLAGMSAREGMLPGRLLLAR